MATKYTVTVLLALALCSQAACQQVSQDAIPAAPGPFDNSSSTLCFGFQFASDFEAAPIEAKLQALFRSSGNAALNPYVALGITVAADGSSGRWVLNHISGSASVPLYYPLTAGGAPNRASPAGGKSVYSYAFQLEDRSCAAPPCDSVTTSAINAVLRNLGKSLIKQFPTAGSKRTRPGITAFELTTFFVRTDPSFTDGAQYAGLGGQPLRRSCKLV